MPNNLGVPEIVGVAVNNGVVGVLGKGKPAISGIGNVLRLFGRGVGSVDSDYTIILVREKSRRILTVDDSGSRENEGVFIVGLEGRWVVGPVVQVRAGSMAPMLVTGYWLGRVIWFC